MKMDGTQYRLVYCDIITGIYCGKWKKGDSLPNLETLCEQYGIGRNTARAAIQLLEEKGYVMRRGRKQPEICFNWEDEELRAKYLEELAERKQSIADVFQFLEMAMPEMFSQIVLLLKEEERNEIIRMLERYIEGLPKSTEQEMADSLMQIYMKALSFTNNELLHNLFYSLYYFIQVPVDNETRKNAKFKMAITLLKYIMRQFQRQVETNDTERLKEQIRFLCQSMKHNTGGYLKRVCRGVDVKEEQKYTWIPQGNTEYLLLAVNIVNEINKGIYKANDILPSYAQLAKEADVSEKTSRNAVKLLNEWKIVTTVNGVGSRVNEFGEREYQTIIGNEMIRENIKRFLEALQIFALTCRPVVRYSVDYEKAEHFRELKSEMTYEEVIRFLFCESNSKVVRSIYTQLSCILKWSSLLERCGMEPRKRGKETVSDMLRMLQQRKSRMLAESIYRDAMEYYSDARQFWEAIKNQ